MTENRETMIELQQFTLWGGYSYSHGEPEPFASLEDACDAWEDRRSSNGLRMVDGTLWPAYGDMGDDDCAITTEHEGWTRAQVLAIANGTAYVDTETMDAIVSGYVSALTWVGLFEYRDDELVSVGAAPDEYGVDDLAPRFLANVRDEVADFVGGLAQDDVDAFLASQGAEQLGHDFFLTRNGHGAGFWDRGLGELGDRLTSAAKVYGEASAELLEDGTIDEL